jgi:WD40 repeat protein
VNSVRIVDLTTGGERTLDTRPKGNDGCEKAGSPTEGLGVPAWLADGRLVTDGEAGLRVWDLDSGTSRLLRPCRATTPGNPVYLTSRGTRAVVRLDAADAPGAMSSLSVFDLVSGTTREITSHGTKVESFALGAQGNILVTGDKNGLIRVGPLSGEEPHLLFGHTATVLSVAVSPDGRWIASASEDGVIRLWPMPDLSKPPLHTLPHAELLAKLESLTNLRAVRDASSDTGWKIAIGPFPGWAKIPEWQP